MANFWNTILNGYNKNSGKRFNHYVTGYENQDKVYHFANILPQIILEFMQEKGLLGLIVYHVTPQGYHHLHIMIGITNIYGESVYINSWTLAVYLNTNIPYLKMQVVLDD